MQRRKTSLPWISCLVVLLLLCGIAGAAAWTAVRIQKQVESTFGPPAAGLDEAQKWSAYLQLGLHAEALTRPTGSNDAKVPFTIDLGETAGSIAARLSEDGLITDSDLFRTYLVYTGSDTRIQAGKYQLSQSLAPVDIAKAIQDATPSEVDFGVLDGWRIEEIAAALPTSGLAITPEEFAAETRNLDIAPGLKSQLPATASLEGFLAPGTYTFKREISVGEMILAMTTRFQEEITPDLIAGFSKNGLDLYQAVTLASIVQREAMVTEEQPAIASVFINRLSTGMKLDSDPTVQFAIGYNQSQQTWWTNPLTSPDLQTDSPYNTYIYPGLPPGPISNPSVSALRAVAFPEQTSYLYFRARCDGTHLHSFATTYEEHVANQCE